MKKRQKAKVKRQKDEEANPGEIVLCTKIVDFISRDKKEKNLAS